MRYFLHISALILVINSSNIYAQDQISDSHCTSTDNSANFPPVRDQGSRGYCWTFAGTALIEEKLCLDDPSKCGKHLSVIDGSRCGWGSNIYSYDKPNQQRGLGAYRSSEAEDEPELLGEGGHISKVLSCAYEEGGICYEEDLPYDFTSRYQKLVMGCVTEKCYFEKIRESHASYRQKENNTNYHLSCYGKRGLFGRLKGFIAVSMNDFSQNMSKFYAQRVNRNNFISDREFYDATYTADTGTDFLRELVINPKCENNRQRLPETDRPYRSISYEEDKEVGKKMRHVNAILLSGKSIATSMCATTFMDRSNCQKDYDCEVGPVGENKECGAHAVVITGSKMVDGKCQLQIRNSWGEGAPIHGWVDAKTFLDTTYRIDYLK